MRGSYQDCSMTVSSATSVSSSSTSNGFARNGTSWRSACARASGDADMRITRAFDAISAIALAGVDAGGLTAGEPVGDRAARRAPVRGRGCFTRHELGTRFLNDSAHVLLPQSSSLHTTEITPVM